MTISKYLNLARCGLHSSPSSEVRIINYLLALVLFYCSSAFSSQDIPLHEHYVHIKGVLPSPYETIDLKIALDPESDDVASFQLRLGDQTIDVPADELAKLKDVNLHSLRITHGMHRDLRRPDQPAHDYSEDYLTIYVTLGQKKRIDFVEKGEEQYLWGYDLAKVFIVPGKKAVVAVHRHGELQSDPDKYVPPLPELGDC